MDLTCLQAGAEILGVLVETHEGRPTKLEGNPLHPASLGSTDATAQALILELWDRDRSQSIQSRHIALVALDWFRHLLHPCYESEKKR